MRPPVIPLLASPAILIATCQPAAAQAPVSVSISAGIGQNGAADGTEAIMRAAGLDGRSTGWGSRAAVAAWFSDYLKRIEP
jgi:hypothetical protein